MPRHMPERVGDTDRDATITHLNLAHTQGYFKDADTLTQRIDAALEAAFATTLWELVADLPSVAELQNVKKKKKPPLTLRERARRAAVIGPILFVTGVGSNITIAQIWGKHAHWSTVPQVFWVIILLITIASFGYSLFGIIER